MRWGGGNKDSVEERKIKKELKEGIEN